jgi:hypothetical protein
MIQIDEIIIAGAGPVGGFNAVLFSLIGLPCTIYEKRDSFTREINVKITDSFFAQVNNALGSLNVEDTFFLNLDKQLKEKNNRILIKDLENLFKEKAIACGARYMISEVSTFDELYDRHQSNNPIIIDCTGRHSKLRVNKFGQDDENMVIIPLESAMHINFRAIFDSLPKDILYSAMKNNNDIKLTEIVASRKITHDEYKNITIPVFISKKLANIFDEYFPEINKEPLIPFGSNNRKTNDFIPNDLFKTISSILGSLILENWIIDFKSIAIKKIEITCGYSKIRSKFCNICLGDSAVHLAFYKSLNFGLRHSLDFFILLSGYNGLSKKVLSHNLYLNNSDILEHFKRKNPSLNPIYVRNTSSRNVFLVVTRVLRYGAYKFCISNHETEQLTSTLGVNESEIEGILLNLNRNLKNWNYLIEKFEQKRAHDIDEIISSNCRKKKMYIFILNTYKIFTFDT